jgi:2,3-bisphosphoglycerate-dependent phosphoglycerate mutase
MPRTECLKDVVARMLPYWEAEIVPDLRAGRTVLVAAQRLSTLELATRAVVLADGRIVEDGSPDALLGEAGPFAELFGDEVVAAA